MVTVVFTELPFNDAVTVALVFFVDCATPVKGAEDCPMRITTLLGVLRELSEEIATVRSLGASEAMDTVHVVLCALAIVDGEHANDVNTGGALMRSE